MKLNIQLSKELNPKKVQANCSFLILYTRYDCGHDRQERNTSHTFKMMQQSERSVSFQVKLSSCVLFSQAALQKGQILQHKTHAFPQEVMVMNLNHLSLEDKLFLGKIYK